MIKVTDLEKSMLVAINNDYNKIGIENTEFTNTFGWDANTNKQLRGAFSSLKKKGIVSHFNDPNCFNPIYPTRKFIEVMKELGIEVSDTVERYVRDDELWSEYSAEYIKWTDDNGFVNWKDSESGIIYSRYPFDRWLKEAKGIEC